MPLVCPAHRNRRLATVDPDFDADSLLSAERFKEKARNAQFKDELYQVQAQIHGSRLRAVV